MPVPSVPSAPSATRLNTPPSAGAVAPTLVLLALLGLGVWAFADLRINVATFVDGAANAARFAARVFPLDFPPLLEILALCGQTLAIVVLATLLSALLSAPVALLAAADTTPNNAARMGARALIVVARAVPDVVLAIVFVRVFGIGSITGVLAMGLHSIGMVGKLYADAIEQSDPGPPTALRATGATRLQRITGAVLPQVLPAFVAVGLHRLDINLRVSVVLGFVGVGGIGFAIAESLRVLNYQRGIALALIVLALCIAVEVVSGAIRTALLGRAAAGPRRGITGALGRLVKPKQQVVVSADPRERSAAALAEGRVTPPWRMRRRGILYAVVSTVIVVASIAGAGISPLAFFEALPRIFEVLGQFLPPQTGGILPTLLAALWVTVKIALAATLIGVVLSIPIGALAAANVAPNARVARFFRLIILIIRGIPELILAIVFVVITGLGEVAGAVALGIGGIGLLGKLVADSLEEVDPGPERALRATGAGRLQVFLAATVPAAGKALVGHALYLLDTNIRSATLLGIVGAGGIGFYLLNAARVLDFGVVTTVLILIFATVMLVELLAMWLRSRW
ncbi:phosphonate ABC transporter, permease protein PhnE [Actinoalloteichus hymeniacidonis]|uniref:Phosphonate ABC transporter, permease protein PhnE n=1 Tax=Actinoalloteichus hymeniacidonis TaxID=340345 RepID=A0AAC9HMT0_9PSEU|nr:phosphonate ABC transporter, permease protein PhnE [Actinoalloteichus hymeniacidonis]AOS62066.1 phosphonate ABC transporter, permease protein PhnE [Actinoalloteichus hymeniacidonis]MBB5909912.1 phosphonate transport system permease protein [Actinoalloteichus hymeniacidonis]